MISVIDIHGNIWFNLTSQSYYTTTIFHGSLIGFNDFEETVFIKNFIIMSKNITLILD